MMHPLDVLWHCLSALGAPDEVAVRLREEAAAVASGDRDEGALADFLGGAVAGVGGGGVNRRGAGGALLLPPAKEGNRALMDTVRGNRTLAVSVLPNMAW